MITNEVTVRMSSPESATTPSVKVRNRMQNRTPTASTAVLTSGSIRWATLRGDRCTASVHRIRWTRFLGGWPPGEQLDKREPDEEPADVGEGGDAAPLTRPVRPRRRSHTPHDT